MWLTPTPCPSQRPPTTLANEQKAALKSSYFDSFLRLPLLAKSHF